MDKLYPGISPTAASRMERIAGSYASMNEQEQQAFTAQLRDSRKRGAKARAITGRSSNAQIDEQQEDGA